LISILTGSCSSRAEDTKVDCDLGLVLGVFLEPDSDWLPDREQGQFAPITGLKVRNGTLWISSHGSDYFPVEVSATSEVIRVRDIRFRRPLPRGNENDPARLVERYRGKQVQFQMSIDSEECGVGRSLKILILSIEDRPDESIGFTRSEKR
jgi:hypothetical protein